MRISVKVKPNAKNPRIEKISANQFCAWVDAPAIDGRANERLVELLSQYFNRPKSRIDLVRGLKGKQKIFDIYEG